MMDKSQIQSFANNSAARLAIIIPAYKLSYFGETLESIASQTCKDFNLYIGDDASPEDLYSIVRKYESRINILYHRFSDNLGSTDLVAHWNRCIDMTGGEEWLWLFSDDDLLESDSVAVFYDFIRENPKEELLHFNVNIVNDRNIQILPTRPFPERMSVTDFFSSKIRSEINSYVIEYVFKKELYVRSGGFENFDLGWCADDASWIKFSNKNGIRTIQKSGVSWRYSGQNISARINDKNLIERKLKATIGYLQWIKKFFSQNGLLDPTSQVEKFRLPLSLISNSPFPIRTKYKWAIYTITELGYSNLRFYTFTYLLYIWLKKKINPFSDFSLLSSRYDKK
jgi:glycosyltransferase involved in cell wall biosynthesis